MEQASQSIRINLTNINQEIMITRTVCHTRGFRHVARSAVSLSSFLVRQMTSIHLGGVLQIE